MELLLIYCYLLLSCVCFLPTVLVYGSTHYSSLRSKHLSFYFIFCIIGLLYLLFNLSGLSFLYFCLFLVTFFLLLWLIVYEVLPYSHQSYDVLILSFLSFLGSFFLIFVEDFVSLYLTVELQTLALYGIAALRNNSAWSVESALKYFVLGSVASSFLVFSLSFLYLITGTCSFSLASFSSYSLFFWFLFVFSLLFKVGVAPFHWWIPDVYQGSSFLAVVYFSLVPKFSLWLVVAKVFHLMNLFEMNFFGYYASIGLFSVLIGSLGGVLQYSFKRLIAYSSIAHAGFLLMIASAVGLGALPSLVIYFLVYVLTLFLLFIIVGSSVVRRDLILLDRLENFRFFYKSNPLLGVILVFAVFSIMGLPPLLGFYVKLYSIYFVLVGNHFVLAVAALFSSVVSIVYYLRLIRFLLFSGKDSSNFVFFCQLRPSSAYLISSVFVFLLLGFFFTDDLYLLIFLLLT